MPEILDIQIVRTARNELPPVGTVRQSTLRVVGMASFEVKGIHGKMSILFVDDFYEQTELADGKVVSYSIDYTKEIPLLRVDSHNLKHTLTGSELYTIAMMASQAAKRSVYQETTSSLSKALYPQN